MNKRALLLFSVVLALLLSVSACGGGAEPTDQKIETGAETPMEPTPTEGSGDGEPSGQPEETGEPVVLRVGWLEPIDCWNPHNCWSFWLTGDLWGDAYTGRGPNCEAVPTRLLDSWDLSEDGLTWTFEIAEGVTFSNGEIGDIEAIAGFLEWWATNPALSTWYRTTDTLESIEIINNETFQLTTSIPNPFFPSVEGNFIYPLPPSVYESVSEDNTFTYENFPPMGAGPYDVSEWEPGSYVIFDARPDYHRGKPPIDRIVLRIYSNADAMVSALIANEIDMTGFLAPEFYATFEDMPNVTLYERVASNRYELEFNVSESGTKHPAIDDLEVREAINHAIDKQQILNVALLGYGSLCPTDWGCPSILPDQHNPNLELAPYDPELAEQILTDAGYEDTDGDGVRESPEGLPLEFRLFYELEQAPSFTIAGMIEESLEAIGIAIDIEALETGVVADLTRERDYDLFIYNQYTDLYAPFQMDFFMSCWSADVGTGYQNLPGYCNEEFDTLVQTAYHALEEDTFEEALFEAESILNREKPFIILAGTSQVQAVRNDRFEFPEEICHVDLGGWLSYSSVMNAVAK